MIDNIRLVDGKLEIHVRRFEGGEDWEPVGRYRSLTDPLWYPTPDELELMAQLLRRATTGAMIRKVQMRFCRGCNRYVVDCPHRQPPVDREPSLGWAAFALVICMGAVVWLGTCA